MSSTLYEALGRATWALAKRQAKKKSSGLLHSPVAITVGAVSALAALGYTLFRSHDAVAD